MTDRYHINPETGRANICRASKACPFGDNDKHYSSAQDARQEYEVSMASKTFTPNKKPRRVRSSSYESYVCPNDNCKTFAHDLRSTSKVKACLDAAVAQGKDRSKLEAEWKKSYEAALKDAQASDVKALEDQMARLKLLMDNGSVRVHQDHLAKAEAVLAFYKETNRLHYLPNVGSRTKPSDFLKQMVLKYSLINERVTKLDYKKFLKTQADHPGILPESGKSVRKIRLGAYESYICPNERCKSYTHNILNHEKIQACIDQAVLDGHDRSRLDEERKRIEGEVLKGDYAVTLKNLESRLNNISLYATNGVIKINRVDFAKARAVADYYMRSTTLTSVPNFASRYSASHVVNNFSLEYDRLASRGEDVNYTDFISSLSPKRSLAPTEYTDGSKTDSSQPAPKERISRAPNAMSLEELSKEIAHEKGLAQELPRSRFRRRKKEKAAPVHTDRHEELQDYIANLDPKSRDLALLYNVMKDDPKYGPNALKKVADSFESAREAARADELLRQAEVESHIEEMINAIEEKHSQ